MNRKRNRKYRIDVKRVTINVLILLAIFMMYNIFTSNIFGKKEIKTREITVASQDTLWSISSRICKNDSSLNIQEVIKDIKEINGLENSNIAIGDVLNIPIYD